MYQSRESLFQKYFGLVIHQGQKKKQTPNRASAVHVRYAILRKIYRCCQRSGYTIYCYLINFTPQNKPSPTQWKVVTNINPYFLKLLNCYYGCNFITDPYLLPAKTNPQRHTRFTLILSCVEVLICSSLIPIVCHPSHHDWRYMYLHIFIIIS